MTETDPRPETYHRPDLSIDQQLALKTAAANLSGQFKGVFGVETIDRFLRSSYEKFALRATIPNPAAGRTVRPATPPGAGQGRRALPRREAGRSLPVHAQRRPFPDGDGLLPALRGRAGDRWSGGSEPGPEVNRAAVEAMRERDINIAGEYPKPWTDEVVRAADVVITMGCGDACPIFPGKRYEERTLDDPAGMDAQGVRPIRDQIEARVLSLLEQLNVPARG